MIDDGGGAGMALMDSCFTSERGEFWIESEKKRVCYSSSALEITTSAVVKGFFLAWIEQASSRVGIDDFDFLTLSILSCHGRLSCRQTNAVLPVSAVDREQQRQDGTKLLGSPCMHVQPFNG